MATTRLERELQAGLGHEMATVAFHAAIYYRVTPGAYDPLTSTQPAPTVTTVPLAVQTEAYQAHELIPDVILPTDLKISIQQREYPDEPSVQHELVVRGMTYSIVGVTEQAPGILWTVQGRRKS